MFLIVALHVMGTINKVITWIESHPQSADIIKTVLACEIFKEVPLFISKPYIEKRNKRIEAETEFYPKLYFEIKELMDKLERYSRLSISGINANNIFLMKCGSRKYEYCNNYRDITPYECSLYLKNVESIEKLLRDYDRINVPPKGTDMKTWYDNQDVLRGFCSFIKEIEKNTDSGYIVEKYDMKSQPVEECQALVNAMNNMMSALRPNKK